MAAYAAVANFKRSVDCAIQYFGLTLSPHYLKTIKFLSKELNSIQECIQRLDVSSRMRLKASLEQIPGVIRACEAVFYDGSIRIEDLKQHALSYIEMLKKLMDDEDCQPLTISSRPKMVGLSDEFTGLKQDLVMDYIEYPFHFFSVVGMAGIGKTTLAKEIFHDLDMLEWFDCRAWVTVGKKYQPEEIIRTILAQVNLDAYEIPTRGIQEMVEYLKESLKDKRYLIVLDDVWDIKLAKDYLEFLFPDDRNGSRVLLTTRLQYKANLNAHSHHHLRLLNKEESWHLLRDKVFVEDICPPELEEVGKKIAEKCDGLPLTIITVANLLSKSEKTKSFWIEVLSQKRHQLFIDAYNEISKVLYPSYEDLTDDLKLCFLYLGVFPQNYQIKKSKLINLWIAEKIIDQRGHYKSLEIFGIECLQVFALFSLIMVSQRSTLSNPAERVKICRLHASWWHFCYKEAKEINFFHVVDSYRDASRKVIKDQSRLTIHNNILFGIKDVCKSMEENCASTAHTLLCLGPYHQYQVPICFSLKLLTKLDALNTRFYEFPLEVLKLIKLRYLALTCNANLPPSISKLQRLQYLIVHQHLSIKFFGAISYLPMRIWNMKKLKHLHVMGRDIPHLGKSTFFRNLSTLLDVTLNSCTVDVINKIPNLKKLGIRIQLTPNVIDTLSFFNISNFSKLESLKCVVVNPVCKFEVAAPLVLLPIFPLNLKKLYLNGLGYPWKEMTNISSLPNLHVLKLRCNAFQGPTWEIEADEFPKLRSLLIEDIDLEEMIGTDGSLKCLQQLSIKHCYKMEWFDLKGLNTISNIEIVDCNPLVGMQIQDYFKNATALPKNFLINSSWNS